jgi:hypothetical protein
VGGDVGLILADHEPGEDQHADDQEAGAERDQPLDGSLRNRKAISPLAA